MKSSAKMLFYKQPQSQTNITFHNNNTEVSILSSGVVMLSIGKNFIVPQVSIRAKPGRNMAILPENTVTRMHKLTYIPLMPKKYINLKCLIHHHVLFRICHKPFQVIRKSPSSYVRLNKKAQDQTMPGKHYNQIQKASPKLITRNKPTSDIDLTRTLMLM